MQSLLNSFEIYTVEQVPRSKNSNADTLTYLALSYEMDLSRIVMVKIMHVSSLTEVEVMDIDCLEMIDWRTPIIKHLEFSLQDLLDKFFTTSTCPLV